MHNQGYRKLTILPLLLLAGAAGGQGGLDATAQRVASFDRDPGWEGHNNRRVNPAPRTIRQDFGYSRTARAGGGVGEIGGFVTPAAEPAYYAKRIPTKTFNDVLTASGTLVVAVGGNLDDGAGNTLIGFFNANTLNEWRTPNTIAFRVNGRGEVFHAHLEYATAKWRAGGNYFSTVDPATGKKSIKGIPSGDVVHRWSLKYDPQGNHGGGSITLTLDGETITQNLDPGHKADGATFNRFGLLNVMKHADQGGSLYLDDVTVNGETEHFDKDPQWEGYHNHRTYTTSDVRPRFDFGYSHTHYAGGKAAGEIGGLIFRGDCRYPDRMAYYGDRLDTLTLERPLRASGKVVLRRGVTDSTVLIGFFHATESMTVNPSQESGIPMNFLGVAIEGPSREGFLFYPLYRVNGNGRDRAVNKNPPYIYPNGQPHDWTLEYSPVGSGRITVTLDGKSVSLDLREGHKAVGARFNRFGLVTTWVDGNGQQVYLNDLSYTWRQG
ncbi:MAG: hypothetical protein NZT92_08060 [Abditibacteriales bacterium]|nr:hypothetical protein [Abditibacteriales bacterium]MDW8366370.1 hypothetical protein [Abditibacteriales bacterium]